MTATISALPTEQVSIVDVSPDLAKAWLGHNIHNRPLRAGVVHKYARDMVKGNWKFNGEAIQFDANEMLANGQHRLHAIIKSNTTQQFLVVTGLPPEAHGTLDGGAKRTPGDVLGLDGYAQGKVLASVARLALQTEQSSSGRDIRASRGFSNQEIVNRAKSDAQMVNTVERILPGIGIPHTMASKSVLGYCYYRLSQIDPDDASEFFSKLTTLANLPTDSPIIALNRRLLTHNQGSRGMNHQFESITYIFMAWNAWRKGEGRTIIKLAFSADGRLRVPIPV